MGVQSALEELERRYRTLLPQDYQERYADVEPLPMGSAGVRYDADGKIAWDQMWGSFCDLAMAGGPPHKGTLLEPAAPIDIEADPAGHAATVAEICRGISTVTDFVPVASSSPGWVRMACDTSGMAAWLLRAITIENVAVRADGVFLELPAGPAYRPLKEIRNVITVMAKTTHYWVGHMSVMHRQDIANQIAAMNDESPLIRPAYEPSESSSDERHALALRLADAIHRSTGLTRSPHRYRDWIGFECGTVQPAVWMMRMLVAANVLARREGTVLFVPLNPEIDADGAILSDSIELVHSVCAAGRRTAAPITRAPP